MLRQLLASSATAALLVTAAAAGPTLRPSATAQAGWQVAQAQQGEQAQPPAAEQPPAGTAQQPPAGQEPPADTAQQPSGQEQAAAPAPMDQTVFITEQAEQQWPASDYLDQTVFNRQDENIGVIDDLIVDENGGLVGLVVGVGGFLGIGKKEVAIDLAAFEMQQGEDNKPKFVIDAPKEALEQAPKFVDKEEQQAEAERRQREAQQPAGVPGGGPMGGAPGGTPSGGPMGGAPGGAQ